MRRSLNLPILIIGVLVVGCIGGLPTKAQATPQASVQIMGVDPGSFPMIDSLVLVRDAYGHGVKGLNANDFQLEEDGHAIPSEVLRVTPSAEIQASMTVALVIDQSALLGSTALVNMRRDAQQFIADLFGKEHLTVEVALIVPRSMTSDAPLIVRSFTGDQSAIDASLQGLTPRQGRTDLYNAVTTAVNISAERAAAHHGPAYVLTLSDGLDTTSIVGSGATGANEAARLAESRQIPIFAWGYGKDIASGSVILRQVADRSAGTYQSNPDEAAIKVVADQMRSGAEGGAYRIRYRSSLTPDGQQHPLKIGLRIPSATLVVETHYLLPRPWSPDTPTQVDMQIDTTAYPTLTLWARPINRLNRTVPSLSVQDMRVTVDGAALDVPLTIGSDPLDAYDPAAAQSVALVVDTQNPASKQVRGMAVMFLKTTLTLPTYAALFMPGIRSEIADFTHDRNALINQLNRTISRPADGGSQGATLLLAIQTAARDGLAHRRPAYVVLFSGSSLPPDLQAQAVSLARDLGVTLHVVTADAGSSDLARLANTTEGRYLQQPTTAALGELARQIAADRAQRYRISLQVPFLADGQTRTLGLTVREQTVAAPFTAVIAGSVTPTLPVSPSIQLIALAVTTTALVATALSVRAAQRWRLRCRRCGQIRRASWNKVCLFCEYTARDYQVNSTTNVPLDGFARQAAALIQQSEPSLPRNVDAGAVHHQPSSNHDPASLAGTPVDVPHANRHPAAQETHVRVAAPSKQVAAAPPSYPNQVIDWVRSQRHTDFWGALPTDGDDDVPASVEQSAPDQLLFDQPSGLPNDRKAQGGAPEADEPVSMPQGQVLVHESGAGGAALSFTGSLSNGDLLREPTHTDFWGPLPLDEWDSDLDSDQIPRSISSDIQPLPVAAPADSGATISGGLPGEQQNTLSAIAAPALGSSNQTYHDQAGSSGNDHQGIIDPTVATEHPNSHAGEASSSYTDFWGPVAPTLLTTEDNH
jgi:Mg-chelatase subunit ChlD